MTRPVNAIRLRSAAVMLPGYQVLCHRGQPVWWGWIGAPIEDVEFDEMILHEDDLAKLQLEAATAKETP